MALPTSWQVTWPTVIAGVLVGAAQSGNGSSARAPGGPTGASPPTITAASAIPQPLRMPSPRIPPARKADRRAQGKRYLQQVGAGQTDVEPGWRELVEP